MNEAIKRPIAERASNSQRGFVHGRQGLDNVVDIDTRARILDMQATGENVPAIMLYDFAAAFPSVSHDFLFMCLIAAGLPDGLIAFFRALYKGNQVFINLNGEVLWLYEIFAGVLQGCPASGSLLVIALDPCLNALNAHLGKNDLCRAFADDIANVVESISTLLKLSKVFDLIRNASNLGLKIKKCVLIPLGGPLTDGLYTKVQNYLNDHLPQWANVRIQDRGEYLGFGVGPKIKEKVWSKPKAKWDSRARRVSAAKLAPSLGVQQYNARAVPTMSYVAQISPLDASIIKTEKSVIQNVFHVLNNTFPMSLIFRMKAISGPQPMSLQVLSYAARYRAAVTTLTTWRENLDKLNKCRYEDAPMGWLAGTVHSTPWWGTPPIVDYVAEAATGFKGKFNLIAKRGRPTTRAKWPTRHTECSK